MIKFILVEDEKNYVSSFSSIISKVMMQNNDSYEIKVFDHYCCDLKKEINDLSVTKVYITDIELNSKISGLDIAREIRQIDWNSEIIFITSHDKMFETVYRSVYKIFDFIEKFHDMEDRLSNDLLDILKMSNDTNKFIYKNSRIDLQIFLKDITYIYRDTVERKIVIQTNTSSFKIGMPLDKAKTQLDKRFKQVHRACILNIDQVNVINWGKGYFILQNGEKVDLCSKNYKGGKNE